MSRPSETKYSVLILGSTQAGKSALIEHIRCYADPDYVINESLLGNGIVSKTENTTPILINSNLPIYEAYRKDTGEIFDLKNLATKYEDEEDYRDILLSHSDNVEMRQIPQDLDASSQSMEFRFLDTPGLNGTQDRDSEHAANIVKEVINTRSFNLIVFVISSQNPLTEEKQLALEYFAFVLRGLHSKVVFLYTYVDYSDTHSTNKTHHLDMSMRNKALSTLFRRHDSGSGFNVNNVTESNTIERDIIEGDIAERDIKLYPSFNINLVTQNRPIVQCLIRSTIREILTMAMAPPAVLDTSALNIERIRGVPYPNIEQRKKFGSEPRTVYSPNRRHQVKQKYSVLVMGMAQAGKSTLVEHIRNYANPDYPIDRSLLGTGNLSKTESTRPFYIESNLPAYEVYRKDTGDILALDDLAKRCEEEEDYRDILFFREKDVGLRLAPHDPNEPSEIVEFRFLDTPGLNDTNDGDSSHAVNIISEMINTRSFNLIVIIVSYKNPLTQEQQLALEYYANVFQGLHSRIIFLHTHVDYADIHHTNTIYHLNMKMKNRNVSKMFRRYDSDVMFDEDNFEEYSSFTIDLVSKKRPVINCLIRNTIREILKMATQPAVMLDTSIQNIERIRAITHPSKFSDEERKKVKARFAAEAAKFEKPAEEEEVDVGGQELEQINILLIGDVQSGKTSLVEIFRLYADTAYQASTEHITRGNSRFADEKVKITAFLADLHTVQIRRLKSSTGEHEVVDLEEEARTLSEEDFEDLLNLGPKSAESNIIPSNGGKKYRFNIYEGPSLNESSETFEENIFSVHKTIVESDQYFHQVLFILAPGRLTRSIRTTIRICSDIFSDLSSLFLFVHTKIDYPKLHHGNKQFQDSMKGRQELLQRYIQSGSNMYLIDCNLQSNRRPVQRAKTLNVAHDILAAATKNYPITLRSHPMKKTPMMIRIDTSLNWQARAAFLPIQKEVIQNNKDLSDIRSQISHLHAEYKDMDERVNRTKNKQDFTTRDDMEIIFEDEYTGAAEPYPAMYSRTMAFNKQPRTIEKVQMVSENIEIEKILGGEESNYCTIVYRRTSGAAASLVVRLYCKKLDADGNPVGETENMAVIRMQRTAAMETLRRAKARSRTLTKLQKEYNLLRFFILREHLPRTVMELLTQEEVYEKRETPYDKIRDIYLKSEAAFGLDPYESNLVATDTNDHGYSILVFGKTQAGKSTFIEFVKNYANQQYDIDDTLLGTGFKSTTGYPIRHIIPSNLPTYSVIDKSGALIDIDTLGDMFKDPEEYLDALNDRKVKLIPTPQDLGTLPPAQVKITFLDTPGIEDTNGRDTEHAPKIIDEMAKLRTLNLIVIIVNCNETPSKSHQLAFDYYSKVIQVLQGCHSNIVFVYTHVDYAHCHHSNIEHTANMEMRHKAFSRLFRGMGHMQGQGSFSRDEIRDEQVELYPWHTVDLKRKHRPIPRCMLLNTLRKILQRAVASPPVPLDTIMKNLIRVYGISHPDELNRLQRGKIMTPMHAILDEGQPESDATSSMSGVKGEDEDGYLSDHFCERLGNSEEEPHSAENGSGSEAEYEEYFGKNGCQKFVDDSDDEFVE